MQARRSVEDREIGVSFRLVEDLQSAGINVKFVTSLAPFLTLAGQRHQETARSWTHNHWKCSAVLY